GPTAPPPPRSATHAANSPAPHTHPDAPRPEPAPPSAHRPAPMHQYSPAKRPHISPNSSPARHRLRPHPSARPPRHRTRRSIHGTTSRPARPHPDAPSDLPSTKASRQIHSARINSATHLRRGPDFMRSG